MDNGLKAKRKNTRYPIELDAAIILPDKSTVRGKTKNMSFGGVYMNCVDSKSLPEGQSCYLELSLEGPPNSTVIKFYAKILHVEEVGAGLKFISIDIFDYERFKKLMLFNSPDPDALLAELEKNPGLDIRKE
jgi:hypothetical protein